MPNLLYSPAVVYRSSPFNEIVTFVVADDGHLYDLYQNGPRWQWEDQGRPPGRTGGTVAINSPSVIYQPAIDRIVTFVVGSDGHVYDKYLDGRRWVWEDQGTPPGATALNSPATVYQSTIDRIVTFVVGDNNHLYDLYYDGGVGQWIWEDLGIPPDTNGIYGSPGVVYQAAIDRIAAFVIGNNGRLYDAYYDQGRQAWFWEDHGPPPNTGGRPDPRAVPEATISPSAVYEPTIDRIIAFISAADGGVYDLFYSEPRWIWETQGSAFFPLRTGPAAIYEGPIDRVVAFVGCERGHLADVFYSKRDQKWKWEDHGIPPTGITDPVAAENFVVSRPGVQVGQDLIVAFVVGSDGRLYDLYYDTRQQWTWEDQGTP
jgi:hypothetical protein